MKDEKRRNPEVEGVSPNSSIKGFVSSKRRIYCEDTDGNCHM